MLSKLIVLSLFHRNSRISIQNEPLFSFIIAILYTKKHQYLKKMSFSNTSKINGNRFERKLLYQLKFKSKNITDIFKYNSFYCNNELLSDIE